MNAAELVDGLIASLGDWRGAALASIRRVIHEADPDVVEEWKWMGSPAWSHDGMICLANAFKDKVKITFPEGASLADPDKLFNNGLAGKQWRSIDISEGDTINERSLKALVREVIDHNHAKGPSASLPHAARANPKKKPEK
ncbi:MAG TPA: DUF1801 domain-containing protein [Clostridia bacterium]|nr:DUF1801 domain-containing protein [Clostridia bacterium]